MSSFAHSVFKNAELLLSLQQDFRKTKADMDNNNTDPTPDPSP
jgi:hypothetical protein